MKYRRRERPIDCICVVCFTLPITHKFTQMRLRGKAETIKYGANMNVNVSLKLLSWKFEGQLRCTLMSFNLAVNNWIVCSTTPHPVTLKVSLDT